MIKVKGLKKTFGDNQVLKGIDVEIEQGEVVVVIGPSGSGKSTFLRCLNLLEVPTEGSINFEGADITDPQNDIDELRQKMGMVFQQFNLFPHKNVIENLTIAPIYVKNESKEEAEKIALELLKRVGLEDKKAAYPNSLSGGQRQRIAIARALIRKKPVLIIDEGTSALDKKNAMEVESALLKNENLTVLLITHHLNEELMDDFDEVVNL